MKQKYIAFLAFLGIIFLPTFALAQTDLSVTEADISIGDSLEPVKEGKEVRIFATINNLGEEDAITDVEFFAGNTLLGKRNVTVLAGESASAFWDWTPEVSQTLEISINLVNISVEDSDESNNSALISSVEVLQGDGISEEENLEEETIEDDTSEETEADEVVDEEQEQVEESSVGEIEVMVQAQRLAWNSFRFMPAGVLDSNGKEFLWNFGDDSTSSDQVAEHSYDKPGTYQVSLQILGGEMPQNASMQVRVGFFHLANWRLWIVIVVLALIIIIGAVVAGMSGSMTDNKPPMQPKVPDPNIAQLNAEPEEDLLASSSSVKDDGVEDELSLLDDLGAPEEDSEPMAAVMSEKVEEEENDEEIVAPEEPKEEGIEPLVEAPAKPKPKKKKTVKKSGTKNKTVKKVAKKNTKTKTTKKKKTPKKK